MSETTEGFIQRKCLVRYLLQKDLMHICMEGWLEEARQRQEWRGETRALLRK
jgi:hypothetical protein